MSTLSEIDSALATVTEITYRVEILQKWLRDRQDAEEEEARNGVKAKAEERIYGGGRGGGKARCPLPGQRIPEYLESRLRAMEEHFAIQHAVQKELIEGVRELRGSVKHLLQRLLDARIP